MKIRSLLTLLFLGACASATPSCSEGLPPIGGRLEVLSKDDLLEDVDFIVAKVEEAHAEPYRFLSNRDFQDLADQLKARVERSDLDDISLLDAYFVYQELAAAIQDEHTEMVFPFDAMLESELYLPFLIGFIEDKLVNIQSIGDAPIPRYAEILEINGVAANRIWSECRKFLNPPLPHAKADLFEKYAPFYLTALLNLHSPWTIRYRTAGSDAGIITTRGITAERLKNGTARSRQYGAYSLQIGNNEIPALDIPSFSYGDFDDYKRFMDEFFARNKNQEDLVVDLRRNPGGNAMSREEQQAKTVEAIAALMKQIGISILERMEERDQFLRAPSSIQLRMSSRNFDPLP
jgi:hypothetical protein